MGGWAGGRLVQAALLGRPEGDCLPAARWCCWLLHVSTHTLPLQPACCRLSDQGGGIHEEDAEAVWQFGFSTTTNTSNSSRRARRRSNSGGGSSPGSDGGGSSGEAGEGEGEGLGMDTTPPGASFGAAWAAMESTVGGAAGGSGGVGGMGRYRIAGGWVGQARTARAQPLVPHRQCSVAQRRWRGTSEVPQPMPPQPLNRTRPHFHCFCAAAAGLGFGLPLSRLYARYFGGDLRLVNMPGCVGGRMGGAACVRFEGKGRRGLCISDASWEPSGTALLAGRAAGVRLGQLLPMISTACAARLALTWCHAGTGWMPSSHSRNWMTQSGRSRGRSCRPACCTAASPAPAPLLAAAAPSERLRWQQQGSGGGNADSLSFSLHARARALNSALLAGWLAAPPPPVSRVSFLTSLGSFPSISCCILTLQHVGMRPCQHRQLHSTRGAAVGLVPVGGAAPVPHLIGPAPFFPGQVCSCAWPHSWQ